MLEGVELFVLISHVDWAVEETLKPFFLARADLYQGALLRFCHLRALDEKLILVVVFSKQKLRRAWSLLRRLFLLFFERQNWLLKRFTFDVKGKLFL